MSTHPRMELEILDASVPDVSAFDPDSLNLAVAMLLAGKSSARRAGDVAELISAAAAVGLSSRPLVHERVLPLARFHTKPLVLQDLQQRGQREPDVPATVASARMARLAAPFVWEESADSSEEAVRFDRDMLRSCDSSGDRACQRIRVRALQGERVGIVGWVFAADTPGNEQQQVVVDGDAYVQRLVDLKPSERVRVVLNVYAAAGGEGETTKSSPLEARVVSNDGRALVVDLQDRPIRLAGAPTSQLKVQVAAPESGPPCWVLLGDGDEGHGPRALWKSIVVKATTPRARRMFGAAFSLAELLCTYHSTALEPHELNPRHIWRTLTPAAAHPLSASDAATLRDFLARRTAASVTRRRRNTREPSEGRGGVVVASPVFSSLRGPELSKWVASVTENRERLVRVWQTAQRKRESSSSKDRRRRSTAPQQEEEDAAAAEEDAAPATEDAAPPPPNDKWDWEDLLDRLRSCYVPTAWFDHTGAWMLGGKGDDGNKESGVTVLLGSQLQSPEAARRMLRQHDSDAAQRVRAVLLSASDGWMDDDPSSAARSSPLLPVSSFLQTTHFLQPSQARGVQPEDTDHDALLRDPDVTEVYYGKLGGRAGANREEPGSEESPTGCGTEWELPGLNMVEQEWGEEALRPCCGRVTDVLTEALQMLSLTASESRRVTQRVSRAVARDLKQQADAYLRARKQLLLQAIRQNTTVGLRLPKTTDLHEIVRSLKGDSRQGQTFREALLAAKSRLAQILKAACPGVLKSVAQVLLESVDEPGKPVQRYLSAATQLGQGSSTIFKTDEEDAPPFLVRPTPLEMGPARRQPKTADVTADMDARVTQVAVALLTPVGLMANPAFRARLQRWNARAAETWNDTEVLLSRCARAAGVAVAEVPVFVQTLRSMQPVVSQFKLAQQCLSSSCLVLHKSGQLPAVPLRSALVSLQPPTASMALLMSYMLACLLAAVTFGGDMDVRGIMEGRRGREPAPQVVKALADVFRGLMVAAEAARGSSSAADVLEDDEAADAARESADADADAEPNLDVEHDPS